MNVRQLVQQILSDTESGVSSVELREQRARISDAARSLTDAASRQNRDLNASERADYDHATAAYRTLTERIETTEARERRDAQDSSPIGGGRSQRSRRSVALTRDESDAEYVRTRGGMRGEDVTQRFLD